MKKSGIEIVGASAAPAATVLPPLTNKRSTYQSRDWKIKYKLEARGKSGLLDEVKRPLLLDVLVLETPQIPPTVEEEKPTEVVSHTPEERRASVVKKQSASGERRRVSVKTPKKETPPAPEPVVVRY